MLASFGPLDPTVQAPQPECTLRAAIMETNANLSLNEIRFAIGNQDFSNGRGMVVNSVSDDVDLRPGDGVCDTGNQVFADRIPGVPRILPKSPLPAMTSSVEIDATTQRVIGAAATGAKIELDGSRAGEQAHGLVFRANKSRVVGLAINQFAKNGILIEADEVTVVANFIGTNSTGTLDLGNRGHGIEIVNAARVSVGDTQPRHGNVISGNHGNGVKISGAQSTQNVVVRNRIGVAIDGILALPNQLAGVRIEKGASANVIGLPELAPCVTSGAEPCGNVISGNRGAGVVIADAGTRENQIRQNMIGVDIRGDFQVANGKDGVRIEQAAAENYVVSTNIISGNLQSGVVIIGNRTSQNVLAGNRIGVGAKPGTIIPNQKSGVVITADDRGGASANRIGTDGDGCQDAAEGNVISGNLDYGIWLNGIGTAQNYIAGNAIGADHSRALVLGNRRGGIVMSDGASHNIIGRDGVLSAGDRFESNVVSGNGRTTIGGDPGILISGTRTIGNVVSGNYIGTNQQLVTNLGNGGAGIRIHDGAQQTIVGGEWEEPIQHGNVVIQNGVSANMTARGSGILVEDVRTFGTRIVGNVIGMVVNGNPDLGNQGHGVWIADATATEVGGLGKNVTQFQNLIAGNMIDGIHVAAGNRNQLRGNRIVDNKRLGINLAGGDEQPTGVTDNDSLDVDQGPNRLQNFPVLYAVAHQGDRMTVEGVLQSAVDDMFWVDLYSNSVPDMTEHGEGGQWRGSFPLATDRQGRAFFRREFEHGEFLSAMATDSNGNSSEFGPSIQFGVDLDTDSDNTGAIEFSEIEDRDERLAPGAIVRWNTDDDNHNGRADYFESVPWSDQERPAVKDDDLSLVKIHDIKAHGIDLSGFLLKLETNGNSVKLWKNRFREPLQTRHWTLGDQTVPTEVYVEGIDSGVSTITLKLISPLGTVVGLDSILISVVHLDLTAYRQQSLGYGSPFLKTQVPEEMEFDPGAGIRRNGDDDNRDGVPDWNQDLVRGENDLVEIAWDIDQGTATHIGFALYRETPDVKFWQDREKRLGLLTGAGDRTWVSDKWERDSAWVEWVTPAQRNVEVRLAAYDLRHGRTAFDDVVKFYPLNSIVVFLGGEGQVPADPVRQTGNEGLFNTAIQMYRNDGYDVYMYDEDHSGLNGTGQVYDDIVSAVNHRGVTQIDIIGYSHGGGSTYTLARRLSRNQSGGLSDIFREFSIRLTAYVDAVRDSGILAETRRPPGSRYHMNFYQQRTLLHGAPSNANEEREVTNLDISHRTIDDLDWILARIRRRILARTKR